MFSGKMKKRRTLTFKLITLYITLYLCSFLLFMFIAFFVFYRSTERNEIKIVNDEIQEIMDKTRNGSFEDLVKESSEEILELGSTNLLIHLKYQDEDYFLPTREAWEGYLNALPNPPRDETISISRQDSMSFLRVGAATLPYGAVLHIGYISNSRKDLIDLFVHISGVIFIPILLAGIAIGYYMVTRSLKDISRVRRTAVEIYRGDLDSRVERSYNGDELDQLSEAFNTMLSRINFLIKNMAEMVDNLAHDLRSPLTKLKANAEIALLSDKPAEFFRGVLEKSLSDYDRIITLINHVLSISEAETGVTPLHFEWVGLKELVESVHEFYAPLAVDSRIEFAMDKIDDLSIRVDKARIWQCLYNIVDNAFRFTGEGGCIRLTAKRCDCCAVIAISDTGIGIAEKDLPYIFERFFKADKGRTEQGYGLGLNLSRAIVVMHGGSIEVDSAVGKGTTFSIILPGCEGCVKGSPLRELNTSDSETVNSTKSNCNRNENRQAK
jgi:signal transduction histidine kinase